MTPTPPSTMALSPSTIQTAVSTTTETLKRVPDSSAARKIHKKLGFILLHVHQIHEQSSPVAEQLSEVKDAFIVSQGMVLTGVLTALMKLTLLDMSQPTESQLDSYFRTLGEMGWKTNGLSRDREEWRVAEWSDKRWSGPKRVQEKLRSVFQVFQRHVGY